MDKYKPKKIDREARRNILDRFAIMRDDPIRKEEEDCWEEADKAYMQYIPDREADDWRSHLVLPDAFSAIQANAQETIDRRGRPLLESVESSDLSQEQFCNDILNFSMDRTGFDDALFEAKLIASIRGTAFLMERYRLDKREVEDPDSIDKDGNIVYKKREIVDYDDTVTEFCENDTIFIDPSAKKIEKARDMIEREILDIKEFKRIYANRPGFKNTQFVEPAGQVTKSCKMFTQAQDVSDDEVEILHYTNRSTDKYQVLANNVLIRNTPIPFKHKELSLIVYRYYMIPGRIYGMGIPRVIFSLSEERASIRRLNLDRQNLNGNKVFLTNDLVDIDDDDLRSAPNHMIQVNTNGLPLGQVIQPLEFGDTPASSFKSEEMLLEDMHRAHGISSNNQNTPTGGTATEAAILQATAQKRINMICVINEMGPLVRCGRLKWSNIQFFYPAPKVARITTDNSEREKKVYRQIRIKGKQYSIKEENGGMSLDSTEIDGNGGFILNPKMASFMEGDYDVTMRADASVVLSKPLQQAKITEMVGAITINPLLAAELDPKKAVQRYLTINDEDPKMWMRGNGYTDEQWQRLAMQEDNVMAAGVPLVGTAGATEVHSMEHLHFTETAAYQMLPMPVQQNIMQHILAEDKGRGGNAGQMMGGVPGPQGGLGSNLPPEANVGDIAPNTPAGAETQNAQLDEQRMA